MLKQIYIKYFSKNKPLRHYSQHMLVGFLVYLIFSFLVGLPFNFFYFSIFILSTYIIDLDSIVSLFTSCKHIPEAQEIVRSLKAGQIGKASAYGITVHKKLNKLLLHNILGLILVLFILFNSVSTKNYFVLTVSGGVFTHFVFDILDDIYQLGHIKNWFWIFKNTTAKGKEDGQHLFA